MLFKVNKNKNNGEIIEVKKFKDFQMGEVKHLQEIVANNPELLGEELLIISKEFNNWDNTSERLDLLALDKDENLVVIENKLDDSGKDVTWQILKYASYVSTLTKQDIIKIFEKYVGDETEKKLIEFFEVENLDEIDLENEKGTQRLIMVANNFRSEITSSVMWMIDNGIQVKCIKATPFEIGNEKVINFEQIIPVKDMEDYLVKVALKTKSDAVVKQQKRRENKIYSIEHHLDGKSEQVKKWYEELRKYIFNKDEYFKEISRQSYIGYKINDRRIFRLSFNKNDFYLGLIFGFNAKRRTEEIKEKFEIEKDNFKVKYDSGDETKKDQGKPYLQIFNDGDFELAKKLVDYTYENLEEEIEKTKKDYYENKK